MFQAGLFLCIVAIGVLVEAEAQTATNPTDAPPQLTYTCEQSGTISITIPGPYKYISSSATGCNLNVPSAATGPLTISGCHLDTEVTVILSKDETILKESSIAMYKLVCNSGVNGKLPSNFTVNISNSLNIDYKEPPKEEHELVGISMNIYKKGNKNPERSFKIGDALVVEIMAPTGPFYGINSCKASGSSGTPISLLGSGSKTELMGSTFEKQHCLQSSSNVCYATSLNAFRFKNDNQVTVQCEVTICKQSIPTQCTLPSTGARRRRDLINQNSTKVQATIEVYDLIVANGGFINRGVSVFLQLLLFWLFWRFGYMQ